MEGYQVSWSLGETVIATFNNENNFLTQGFHQSFLKVTPVFSILNDLRIKVFPNPASQKVYINKNSNLTFSYKLFTLEGKVIKEGILDSETTEMDVHSLANGVYPLKIFENKELRGTYKVIKNL